MSIKRQTLSRESGVLFLLEGKRMITPFRQFIQRLDTLFNDTHLSSRQRQQHSAHLLEKLIASKNWLPEEYAEPNPERYRQQLLYVDLYERFSVLSFCWGPGQFTPIHDHGVWGVVGVMQGAEVELLYEQVEGGKLELMGSTTLHAGDISVICPRQGDIHQVKNAYPDKTSLSIHVYAGNIGRIERHCYDPETGEAHAFISHYENNTVPNLWFDRAAQ